MPGPEPRILSFSQGHDTPPTFHKTQERPIDGPSVGAQELSAKEVAQLRGETPGVEGGIHLNNAGAGLMPTRVLNAVQEHLELEAVQGGYEAATLRRSAMDEAYADVAKLVKASPDRVAFLESATVGVAQALSSIPFRPGDRIVTTRDDYVSNQIMYISLRERLQVEVIRAPDGPEGGVDLGALEELIHRKAPRLVSVTHVPTNSGLVQPVEEIGVMARHRDVLYLVDACQSVGQIPVDVEAWGCDFLAASARKYLRGPRGTGFLYLSDRVLEQGLEPLFPDLRGADWVDDDLYQPAADARRFETWESSVAGLLGMGAAARYARDVGVERGGRRAFRLAALLRERLAGLPGVRVLDRGSRLCAIVTVAVEGWRPRELVRSLRAQGVRTSASELGSGLLDFRDKGVEGALRLSPHYYNTEEEVHEAVDRLEGILTGSSDSGP